MDRATSPVSPLAVRSGERAMLSVRLRIGLIPVSLSTRNLGNPLRLRRASPAVRLPSPTRDELDAPDPTSAAGLLTPPGRLPHAPARAAAASAPASSLTCLPTPAISQPWPTPRVPLAASPLPSIAFLAPPRQRSISLSTSQCRRATHSCLAGRPASLVLLFPCHRRTPVERACSIHRRATYGSYRWTPRKRPREWWSTSRRSPDREGATLPLRPR